MLCNYADTLKQSLLKSCQSQRYALLISASVGVDLHNTLR